MPDIPLSAPADDPDSSTADPFANDAFCNEAWQRSQRRIDWDKCRKLEADGISTAWPRDFIVAPDESLR